MFRPIPSTSTHIFRAHVARAILRPSRQHSTAAHLPAFSPEGRSSANTQIPYGSPSLASSAYLPSHPTSLTSSSTASSSQIDIAATAATSTPTDLTPKQRQVLERIIRVDQAGELGANYIYMGQLAVLSRGKDKRVIELIQHMWDGEKKHIAAFDKIVSQHGVRPTLLYPIWKAAGFALGAGTAMMGKRSAMACTEAVETIIGEHYDSQIKSLTSAFPTTGATGAPTHPSISLLKEVLAEFRDDELEHLDTAIKEESQMAPIHALLSAVVAGGCRVAILATERI